MMVGSFACIPDPCVMVGLPNLSLIPRRLPYSAAFYQGVKGTVTQEVLAIEPGRNESEGVVLDGEAHVGGGKEA